MARGVEYMGFMDRFRSPAPPVQREVKVALGTSSATGAFFRTGQLGAITPSGALGLYEKSTAVSVPINMIVDSFKSVVPILLINGSMVDQHPLLELLQNPSPYFTRSQLFEVMGKDYLITGNTYLAGLGSPSRPPLELQPISPRSVQVVPGQGGLPRQYTVGGDSMGGAYERIDTTDGVAFVRGPAADMKQIRMYSTKSNSLLEGQSKLLAATQEARQHILGGQHNVSLLENGGRLSLVFHFAADMDDQTFEDAKQRIYAQFGGPTNVGKIGVTAGGADTMQIKEFGVNAKDMDFANLQNMAKQAVALQYRVPLPLVTTEASTFNNYTEAKLALYDDAVIPLTMDIFGGLADWLFPRFKLNRSRDLLMFDHGKVTTLAMRRNSEMKIRRDIDVETDNELRDLMSLEPYPEGDIHFKPANLVPAGTEPILPAPPTGDEL